VAEKIALEKILLEKTLLKKRKGRAGKPRRASHSKRWEKRLACV